MTKPRIHLACVPGVNTGPAFDYLTPWADALQMPAHLTEVRWPSRDCPVTDWTGIRVNPDFRKRAFHRVRDGLRSWAGFASGPRCVIAHSMGVPLAMRAIAELRLPLPLIGIGSPMTHPLLGRKLEKVGLGHMPNEKPKVFSNRGDYICALWTPFGNWWRSPKYMERVEVEIDASPVREHDAEKYLALPEVQEAVKRAASRGS